MSGYLESFEADSYAKYAAEDADAAAEVPNELVPPPIDLTPEFAQEQQERFRGLMAEGRPGADTIYDVYVEDERLQETAGITYGEFVATARLATKSVVRFDALSQAIDQDGDLRSNFVLDDQTREATTEALQDRDANKEGNSLADAMRGLSVARKELLAVKMSVSAETIEACAAEEDLKAAAAEDELGEIEENIETVKKVAGLIDIGVSAATGSGATSLAGVMKSVATMGNAEKAISKGADLAGAGFDPLSLPDVAGMGARLYYAEEIGALQKQIKAAKSAASTLRSSSARRKLNALYVELEAKTEAYEQAAKAADTAMEDRRKQYAEAGKAVDKDARSAGAEEGEVSESLLLGSAAEEAKLMVSMGRLAGDEAALAVDDAYSNARKRDDTSYQTEEDMSEINGRKQYLTRGRFESLADDPDLSKLYQMEKAIQKWQEAADQADAHLDGVVGSFRGNITDHAGVGEY